MDIESKKAITEIQKRIKKTKEMIFGFETEVEFLEGIKRIIKNSTGVNPAIYCNQAIIDDKFVYLTDEQFKTMIKRKDEQFKEQEETQRRRIEVEKIQAVVERRKLDRAYREEIRERKAIRKFEREVKAEKKKLKVKKNEKV